MNLRTTITGVLPWLLAGGLVASTFWNYQLLSRVESLESRAAAPAKTIVRPCGKVVSELPRLLVTRLQLTEEQCEQIRGCSMT